MIFRYTALLLALSGWAHAQQAPAPVPEPARTGFTISDTQLEVTLQPAQSMAEITGKLTIRNDGNTALSQIFLQLTSAARWQHVDRGSTPLEMTTHRVPSDVDHTAFVEEARITLDRPLPARASTEVNIAYGLTVKLESARLRAAGAPESAAQTTDWDRISPEFTAVRGVGYVLWYPVALTPAMLAEGNSVFQAIAEWRAHEQQSRFSVTVHDGARTATKTYAPLGTTVPVLTAPADFAPSQDGVEIVRGAEKPGAIAIKLNTLQFVRAWLPPQSNDIVVWTLPEPGDLPFSSGSEIFVPPGVRDPDLQALTMYAFTHAALHSDRAWIQEGYAAFLDAEFRESDVGRDSAIAFLDDRIGGLALSEPSDETSNTALTSLINSPEEIRFRTKAMFVWWMLHDILGDSAVQRAIKAYKASDDRDAYYMQRLLERESGRDLSWLFNDWIYRDRGLPELSISEASYRRVLGGGYVAQVVVANDGGAAASVRVFVQGDAPKSGLGAELKETRIQVAAHAKATASVSMQSVPTRAQVNDGSVPETDMQNDEADFAVAGAAAKHP